MAEPEPSEAQGTSPQQPLSRSPPPPQTPLQISLLATFQPKLYQRAWASVPHPTLPLLATAHGRAVTVFSLSTLSRHSVLERGHDRSVRSAAWMPPRPRAPRAAAAAAARGTDDGDDDDVDKDDADADASDEIPCLATSSFDGRAALWRWTGNRGLGGGGGRGKDGHDNKGDDVGDLAEDVQASLARKERRGRDREGREEEGKEEEGEEEEDWEFWVDFSGHDNEVKCAAFSPSGQYLATCSRDKTVWVWEDVGARRADGEWETVSVLTEHDGDVKCVAWCPTPHDSSSSSNSHYSHDALASASYDGTARVWREDADGEFACVAVLEAGGHAGATVWGVQWEQQHQQPPQQRGKERSRSPRLLTWSADGEVKVWTRREEEGSEDTGGQQGGGTATTTTTANLPPLLGGPLPSTMRGSLREEWTCTAVLPRAHSRDVYSACWSAETGLVASTGSDGVVAVYAEDGEGGEGAEGVVALEDRDGDVDIASPGDGGGGSASDAAASSPPQTTATAATTADSAAPASKPAAPSAGHDTPRETRRRDGWRVVGTVEGGHGAYEINHVAWCKRFDKGAAVGKGSQQRGLRGGDRGREEMLVTTGDDGTVRAWTITGPVWREGSAWLNYNNN